MRRSSLVVVALIIGALPQAAHAQSTGGSEYTPIETPTFVITPTTIAPGETLTVRYQITGVVGRVRVRIDLLPETGGPPAATRHLGRKRTGREYRARWRPRLAPGRYTARLRATTVRRRNRARISSTSAVEIQGATPVSATPGVFPVQGTYSFGGADSRFGAKRPDHTHQGQDISAAAGTPLVAPRTGFISWVAYQANGAGHYVVLAGDDGRHYVFMHMKSGSVTVEKGQGVRAGQQIGQVGSSGASSGPHLHFEIWVNGWYESEQSHPIDPLPDLLAWAAG